MTGSEEPTAGDAGCRGMPTIPGLPSVPGMPDLPEMPALAGARNGTALRSTNGNGHAASGPPRDEWDF